eukprot:Skav235993  [mRNA]  locus=scaffold348:204099:221219:+ [translate_table: standard]
MYPRKSSQIHPLKTAISGQSYPSDTPRGTGVISQSYPSDQLTQEHHGGTTMVAAARYGLFVVLGLITLFIVAWIVDIAVRPVVNSEGLREALNARSRSKVRMPKASGAEGRELYPLDTNLLKTPVAGIGVQLHFNFQFFLIVWALAIGLAWLLLALSVDDALLILGTRRAKTARQKLGPRNCILVAWGFETQQRLMWTKIDFVVAYILTFLGCIAFGIRQLRIFQKVDMQNSTHKVRDQDYAARIRNLPLMDGTEPVEDELKKRDSEDASWGLEEATGQKVVGVSVCWDFQEHEDELLELIESKLVEKEEKLHPVPVSTEDQPEPESCFAASGRGYGDECIDKGPIRLEIRNSAYLLPIFLTLAGEQPKQLKPGQPLGCPPGHLPKLRGFFARMERSLLAADAERVVAKGEMTEEELRGVTGRHKDMHWMVQVCYMLLYCFACVFNVALDLITTYMVAYRINVGLRMKTYDGTLLENLQQFSDTFESYAMQRTLANNLYAYAFPATFLIPFLIEPVATIYAPYKMMLAIVRTQPSMKGFMAERLLGSLVFDLSRYADLMLDVMIAVLIFFFPGGYNIQMFVGLAGSHVYIYFFDHYRVLRSIQSCNYADKMVDWWTQWLMCIPCGFMLACVVFKALPCVVIANCQPGYFCVDGNTMVAGCTVAFFAHIILHTLALKFVVPIFGLQGILTRLNGSAVSGESDGAETNTYQDCSKRIACSWFSSNPIYCLRSQYIYQHSPPCLFCIPGKEHLIEVNEDIGLYFNDCAAKESNGGAVGHRYPWHRRKKHKADVDLTQLEEDYDAPHVDVDAVKANLKDTVPKSNSYQLWRSLCLATI